MPREIIQAVPYADGVSRRVTLSWGWSPEKSDVVALLEIDEHDSQKFEDRLEIGPTGQTQAQIWSSLVSIPLYGSEIEGLIRSARRAEKSWQRLTREEYLKRTACTCATSAEGCSNCAPSEVSPVHCSRTDVHEHVVGSDGPFFIHTGV